MAAPVSHDSRQESGQNFGALMAWYDDLVAGGILRRDPRQEVIVKKLQAVIDQIDSEAPEKPDGFFTRVFSTRREKRSDVRGLYVYGGVGRGKTMLMDKAFELFRVEKKRRCHFNDFMLDVHRRLRDVRARSVASSGASVAFLDMVADDIAKETRLLAFDEFQVRDIADAMILSGLFKALFVRGVTVLATSNVAPDDLYRDGLHRDRFMPFVDVLKAHVDVEPLQSETDYRLISREARGIGEEQSGLTSGDTIFTPANSVASARMREMFEAMMQGQGAESEILHPEILRVAGREWTIAQAAGKICWLSFAEVCEQPRAAEDYITLANRFEYVFLEGVPKMGYDRRNEAKRFILFIDVLYDKGCRFAMTAEAEPERLYSGHDHQFEFQRTISRLQEMRRTSLPPF